MVTLVGSVSDASVVMQGAVGLFSLTPGPVPWMQMDVHGDNPTVALFCNSPRFNSGTIS